MRSFRVRAIAALAAAASLLGASIASAQDIRVALDQAFPVRLADAAQGVAIGNPSIAGVSVQNDHFLFVTGRSYGSTNLVVVGDNGRILYSGRVIVTPDETGAVIVTRGTEMARLECSPVCRPRPDIGDGAAAAAVNDQITTHASTATSTH
ncbi:MAG TPA: pilus assembly protein N-terminal domain-containing protein [Vitreimonas sp.]|jgi:Flp pilus assembly secretin CpaC|nr:pilus assembly protein N-terminal domain-containing protein [Vitreimonas sp.]